MGKVLVGMTMSLDGFIHDRNGDVSRLYPDLEALRKTGVLWHPAGSSHQLDHFRGSNRMLCRDQGNPPIFCARFRVWQ
jgi:hypothetical protein